jgi:hypothetical protein
MKLSRNFGIVSSGPGLDPVTNICERGNGTPSFIITIEFLTSRVTINFSMKTL